MSIIDNLVNISTELKAIDESKVDKLLDVFKKYLYDQQIAEIYTSIGSYDKANELFENLDTFEALVGRCKNYNEVFRYQEVVDLLAKYESRNDFWCNSVLAVAYMYTGNKDKAFDLLFKLLTPDLHPGYVKQIYRLLNPYYFERDDFKSGIKCLHVNDKIEFPYTKYWDGIIRPGVRIIINYNGGIGDQIVNARFYKWFKDRGMLPEVYTNFVHLKEVFENNGIKVTMDTAGLSGYIVNLRDNLCDIPYKAEMGPEDVWYGPYLFPSQKAIDKFKGYSGIGVKFFGDTKFLFDATRCVDIDQLYEVLPKRTLYSLHFDEVLNYKDIVDMNDKLTSIDDTMGLIYNLDCVITTCTSVAHMAAAMGKKVFVLTPMCVFFTWVPYKGKIVWYDSATCHYQTEFKKWDYKKIGEELTQFMETL